MTSALGAFSVQLVSSQPLIVVDVSRANPASFHPTVAAVTHAQRTNLPPLGRLSAPLVDADPSQMPRRLVASYAPLDSSPLEMTFARLVQSEKFPRSRARASVTLVE
jgi:hypothetical protein